MNYRCPTTGQYVNK